MKRYEYDLSTVETTGDGSLTGRIAVSSAEVLELLSVNDPDMPWQDGALCLQTDPEAFFPEKNSLAREAKKVCSNCEVRVECLNHALANDEKYGVWGGLTERERRKLKKQKTE